jgi:CRISPR-associated protein Csm1
MERESNEKEKFQILILAALLHDIGKFYQRTSIEPKFFREFNEKDYGEHEAHSKWSASFVNEYLPEKFIGVASPVLYHHNPQDELSKIINKADHLSEGERISAFGTDPQKTRLLPVLGRIFRPGWADKGFYIKPLNLEKEDIFPLALATSPDLKAEYLNQWNLFIAEVAALEKTISFEIYLMNLFYLLQKYTWCIPSATYKSEPDISLFDHLKTTAAIATVIYKSNMDCKFRLIGGDISGIQNFIYKLSSPDEAQTGMAQRLRGRSFYLSLLNETIALFILEELNLPITNLLWCGGGQFTILGNCNNSLSKITEEIESFLSERYQGELAINLTNIDIDEKGLLDFGNSLNSLSYEIQKVKEHKFINLRWHKPFELSTNVCKVCGKDDQKKICSDCENHEKIGERIAYSKYLIRVPSDTVLNEHLFPVEFKEFRITWVLATSHKYLPNEAHSIYMLNSTQMTTNFIPKKVGVGFKFLAQQVPKDGQRILTFDDIEGKSLGAKFLGALRMDMDDLGIIFTFGLGENRSLSRIASLSRSIDLFFSGYLNKIAESMNSAYILYSGGDDLFIVACWNETIEIARKIYEELEAYSGNNHNIHISGGIHLFKHKFPIGLAANISKDKLEGKAKEHKSKDGKNKDSLSVFEFPVFWNEALESLDFAHLLLPKIETKELSHSFIYKILQIYWTHFKDDIEDISWVPKFCYHLKRNVPLKDKTEEENELFGQLLEKMPNMIKTAPIWATYVLLATREKKSGGFYDSTGRI